MKNSLFIATILAVPALVWVSCTQETTYTQGKILYTNFCENCHMADGSGLEGVIPPLAGADFLKDHPEQVPCIIHAGISGEMVVNGRKFQNAMPGSPKLSEFEITNIINYIHTSWGNQLPIVQHPDVRELLKQCDGQAMPLEPGTSPKPQ